MKSQPTKRGVPRWIWVLLAVFGGSALLLCMACGGLALWFVDRTSISAAAREPFSYDDVALPSFAGRGERRALAPGVDLYTIRLGTANDGYYRTPGHGGVVWLYLPAGEHADKSLPCILIAPAGATVGSGMLLADADQPEHLPYVEAGYAVLAYEVDGPLTDTDSTSDAQLKRAYQHFSASRAGLVNARNALEYVLAKVTEVDPTRIYAAGHSSAADLSLLFAAHEPRLAGCIAYMPSYDHLQWLQPAGVRVWSLLIPGAGDFIVQSSPHTHVNRLSCPVYLFHAVDDQNIPLEVVRRGAGEMQSAGVDVTFQTAAAGGHYYAMLEEGIPRAIEWLRNPKL